MELEPQMSQVSLEWKIRCAMVFFLLRRFNLSKKMLIVAACIINCEYGTINANIFREGTLETSQNDSAPCISMKKSDSAQFPHRTCSVLQVPSNQ